MSLFHPSPVIAALATTALVVSAHVSALACTAGEEATVRWNLTALGRAPVSGSVDVQYTITPNAPVVDPVDCDPLVEPCDEACDPLVENCDEACDPLVENCDEACDPLVENCDEACDPLVENCDEACDPLVENCDEACDPLVEQCDDACDPLVENCDEACDPLVENCDEACDPLVENCDDATQPEPVTGSLSIALNTPTETLLPIGAAEFVVEFPGFEPLLIDRQLCGQVSIQGTLLPDAPATLQMRLSTWLDIASPAGAKVLLEGLDGRGGERYEGEAAADGTVSIADIAPGFYRLSVVLTLDGSKESIRLDFVDLLGDAQISARLQSSLDLPNTRVSCSSTSTGGGSAAALWLSLLGLMLVSRRRHA